MPHNNNNISPLLPQSHAHPLIAAIRYRADLKEAVLHTAQEIAARASIYGVSRVSYTFLAPKCHCCKQTVINHVKILESKGIFKVVRQRLAGKLVHERNVYKFILPWKRSTPPNRTERASQNSGRNLPLQEGREKNMSIREEINRLERGLRVVGSPPGSLNYESTMEKIAALTALLPESKRPVPD